MNTGYWDRLQAIIDVAKFLQSSPVPEDEILRQIHLMRLGYAEYELNSIAKDIKEMMR